MTGRRVCITNDVRDLRPCVVKGKHRSNCDGWARRYNPETGQTDAVYTIEWNKTTGENDRWLVSCDGCLPRTAVHGLLCETHKVKLEHAVEVDDTNRFVLVDLITHMWSIESSGVRDDNDRVSSSSHGSRWTLSESHIQANALYSALANLAVMISTDLRIREPRFSAAASILDGFTVDLDVDVVGVIVRDLLEWVVERIDRAISRRRTAEASVRLINSAQAALARFPLVDLEHRIPLVRCPGCARMSMSWRPPLMVKGDVIIKCERCGHEETQEWLEHYIAAVKTDPRRVAAYLGSRP